MRRVVKWSSQAPTPNQDGGMLPGVLMWLVGIPIPIIILIYLLMGGCS